MAVAGVESNEGSLECEAQGLKYKYERPIMVVSATSERCNKLSELTLDALLFLHDGSMVERRL